MTMAWTDAAALGIFVPIVVMSARAVYLVGLHFIVPATKQAGFEWREHLVGIAAFCALASHLLEGVFYGTARWTQDMSMLSGYLPLVALMKALILAGCVCIIGATSFRTHRHPIRDATLKALALWLIGTVAAYLLVP
jgi:hypothetical protein